VKQSPVARRRQPVSLLFLGLAVCAGPLLAACNKATESAPEIVVEHEIAPYPPKVGQATVTLKLFGSGGVPQSEAQVSLEANMSHAGMRPVIGEAKEVGPGRYQAPVEFTMRGDWIILIHITLPDGRKLQRQIEIKAVQPE
jgi:YtkA-like protein